MKSSLQLECRLCGETVLAEIDECGASIETTACAACDAKLCEYCNKTECESCGATICADCAEAGRGECVDCVADRLAELESADAPCTCGTGDYADVRGCEACDPESPVRRRLAAAEAVAAAVGLRRGPHSSDCPVWVSEACACNAGKLYRGVAA